MNVKHRKARHRKEADVSERGSPIVRLLLVIVAVLVVAQLCTTAEEPAPLPDFNPGATAPW